MTIKRRHARRFYGLSRVEQEEQRGSRQTKEHKELMHTLRPVSTSEIVAKYTDAYINELVRLGALTSDRDGWQA